MTTSFPVDLDAPHRRCLVGNEPVIFHCHHFNTYLQQTLLDAEYLDTPKILVGAANEAAFHQLTSLFDRQAVQAVPERKKLAEELYRWAGFGKIDLSSLTAEGGTVSTDYSHYSQAWKVKLGKASKPVDFFTSGWLAGALSAVYDLPQDAFSATQLKCMAKEDELNVFSLTPGGPNYAVYTSPAGGTLSKQVIQETPVSPVDEDAVFQALGELPLAGDPDTGLIEAFGVILTRHYANYYNRISFEFERELAATFGMEGLEIAEPLLVESGHVCAFNTFGGIMKSMEWQGLIQPQLSTKEHWVQGMVACINALGWGRWQAVEISPGIAKFIIHNDYESIGYRAMYGRADHNISYLAKGAAMGIMDLIYIGHIEDGPTLDPAFYNQLFKAEHSYRGEVVKSLAMGDAYTEIHVLQ
ncbi:MAG: 4-vinyl reductase [Acidobacteriota bacterium]|nr:4-vinyl reductase [Acidobacteriota bacterium]